MWQNVKSTLKQRCIRQRGNLQRGTLSVSTNQRINVVYFNVDLNNVRQSRNNVVIFNVDFHNVGQLRNSVVNITIWKKINKNQALSQKQNNIFELQRIR